MNRGKLKERMNRVRRMNRVLDSLFPDAKIELNYTTPFELLVAVILSAQCTDKRVNVVTEKLFKKYRTIKSYAEADPREFERVIFSCGFYRAKTKNILGAARMLRTKFKGRIPQTMEEMLKLPGVARKTANVVLSNLYGATEGVAVDTHVRRFSIRFDLSDHSDPVRIERDLMQIMPREYWWKFNHQLVLYGRNLCPARPHECASHPLTKIYPEAASVWPKAH